MDAETVKLMAALLVARSRWAQRDCAERRHDHPRLKSRQVQRAEARAEAKRRARGREE